MSENNLSDRRLERKKRRKRSRLIAFIVTIVLLAAIGVGAFLGITALTVYMADKKNAEVVEVTPEPTAEPTPEVVVEEVEPTPEVVVEEEPTPTPEEISKEDLLDELVEGIIADMTLEDKVAGLFIVTPEKLTGQGGVTKAGDGTKTALEQYPVGGIIYAKGNIKSADQFKEMLDNTNSYAKYPLFIAVEEEGGKESGIASALKLEGIASAKELGAGDSTGVYNAYNQMGTYLYENGINLTFAPNADVLADENNKFIGDRSFGTDANTVADMVVMANNGLKDAGVTACIKHFPGQGYADGDAHNTMASTDNSMEHMKISELVPFEKAIANDVSMIMIGHFAAPELTGDNMPCSMSKEVITDLLRVEMGYNGVIISDAMNVPVISEYYTSDEIAIKAIKAGSDMILMPEDFKLAHEAVVNAVNEGTIDEQRINDSLKRIYKIKYASAVE